MKVITLCGSTKFKEQFEKANAFLTLKGNAVISLGFFEQSEGIEITQEQEELFAKIHFRKIDLADEIFIIDVNGYIGNSTRKEIEYATQAGKPVRYYSQSKWGPLTSAEKAHTVN
jgi:nucleoside 2-deoxyribosyltransferase